MSALDKINAHEMVDAINNASYDKDIQAVIKTSKGDIALDLYASKTPKTVANFATLAKKGYYDNLNFHRVIEEFMIQGGCPFGTGTGSPGYNFQDEFHPDLVHDDMGILSMANSGPASNGSQFFITHLPTPWLDGNHTVFGKVKSDADMDVVNSIEKGDSIITIEITE
jgi:peptidyl-prolyl cis-trans isomerase B (cyclophilin B)